MTDDVITWDKKRSITFHGRTSTVYCCGFRLLYLDPSRKGGVIHVKPIISRGRLGDCSYIEIPLQDLKEVIHALKSLQTAIKKQRRKGKAK